MRSGPLRLTGEGPLGLSLIIALTLSVDAPTDSDDERRSSFVQRI